MSVNMPANAPRPTKRGYHKLALFMTSQDDTAMFRRFTKLNMLNLMSLQAELMDLETQFSDVWDSDESNAQNKAFSVNFNLLRKAQRPLSPVDESDDESKDRSELQWQILMTIRTKLNEYNDTLLQVAKVCALSEPEKESVEQLRRWLVDADYGNGEIVGPERKAWDETFFKDGRRGPNDLVAVRTKTLEKAPFSAWASGGLLTLFHGMCGFKLSGSSTKGDPEAGPDIYNYKETTIQRYARYLVMILASLLPVVCIVVLNAVKSVGWRLGATAFFTAGFASALVIFTSAKEVEVFASTAAFAAVEVIFIGSALTSSDRGNSTAGK